MPRLVINPGTPTAWEIQLKQGANLLGRGFANDFKIEDPSVSGSHCQIVVANQTAVIKDLGSTNGTFINRAPVKEAVLLPGQIIHVGGVAMVYQTDAPPSATVAETELLPRPTAVPVAALLPTAPPATPPVRVASAAHLRSHESVPSATPVARPTATRVATATPAPPALAVTRQAPPPPPVVPPPIAPTVAATAVTAPENCKFHPKTPGRFFCNKCRQFFCELCVASRAVGSLTKKFCRHCGAECVPVQVHIPRAAGPKSFYGELPGAFLFPFRGSGFLVLIVATMLFAALNWMSPGMRFGYIPRGFGWGLCLQVFALGYFFAYMQTILHATAVGDEEMPGLPSMASFWEHILLPCLQLLGLLAICFGPAIAVAWWTISTEDASPVLLISTFVLCGLYFPMAFLAVALLDSVLAANPLQVVPSIFKVPLEYLVTMVVVGVVMALRPLGDAVLPLVFPKGLSTHSMPKLFAYLGASAFWSLASFYLLTVSMRILGLLYLTKKDKLGWLER